MYAGIAVLLLVALAAVAISWAFVVRKKTETQLRESEERYRTLFEQNPLPMWVYDLGTLSFLAVNEAAIRHYGYSREEFMAMRLTDIRPAEDVPALFQDLATTSPGGNEVHVRRHRKK